MDCGELRAALSSAASGDTVRVDACQAAGALTVPAGVTLQGEGQGRTFLTATGEEVTLTLEPGAAVADLTVEAGDLGGIRASRNGDWVSIANVQVIAERGYGIRVDDVGVTMSRVTVQGPVDADNATTLPPMPRSDATATHGILLTNVGSEATPVTLTDITTTGFARFGALVRESVVRWSGGNASENLSVGIMVRGGSAVLSDVEICGTFQGFQPLPAYGAVFAGGAIISTERLLVCDNEGLGVLHDSATVSHLDLTGSTNGDVALWAQQSDSFELVGADSTLTGNGLAGIVLIETPDATVHGAQIDGSRLLTRIEGEIGEVRVGDGIHAILRSTAELRIEDVSFAGNERAGILLDVEDGVVADAALTGVQVEGVGEALGVIAQSPSGLIASGTWDAAVTRLGATVVNDAALGEKLDIVGIVQPMFFPPVTD